MQTEMEKKYQHIFLMKNCFMDTSEAKSEG